MKILFSGLLSKHLLQFEISVISTSSVASALSHQLVNVILFVPQLFEFKGGDKTA